MAASAAATVSTNIAKAWPIRSFRKTENATKLMLLAVNINFVAFSVALDDLAGQVFAMFVLTVAAAEAAIGLAILVVYFRNRGTIQVEDIHMMRG